jgi:hypothetical protein
LDAVAKYGGNLMEEDLSKPYRRAGVVFRGQLQQNFVILYDKRIDCQAQTGHTGIRGPQGDKEQMEGALKRKRNN